MEIELSYIIKDHNTMHDFLFCLVIIFISVFWFLNNTEDAL